MTPLNADNSGDVFDEIFRQAQSQGKFDNLPGKGKPLNFDTRPDDHAAGVFNDVLKDNNVVPEWVALAQEIDRSYQALFQQAVQSAQWVQQGLATLGGRKDLPAQQERDFLLAQKRQARDRLTTGLTELNSKIIEYNLKAPNIALQRFKFNIAEQMTLAGLD